MEDLNLVAGKAWVSGSVQDIRRKKKNEGGKEEEEEEWVREEEEEEWARREEVMPVC